MMNRFSLTSKIICCEGNTERHLPYGKLDVLYLVGYIDMRSDVAIFYHGVRHLKIFPTFRTPIGLMLFPEWI